MTTTSVWQQTALPEFSPLAASRDCDVAIVGGGMTGLCSAYLLAQAGLRVCLLERDRLANVNTGHTTAHLTYVTDVRLSELVRTFGKDTARLIWDGHRMAIELFESIAEAESIDCQLQRLPGFLHGAIFSKSDETSSLEKEYKLARELGYQASFIDEVPVMGRPGIRFPNVARFHPRMFLAGLARAIHKAGCQVFEQSEVTEVTDNPLTVKANGHTVRCQHLVVATDVPIMGKTDLVSATIFQSKLAPYSSYVLGAHVPAGAVPDALYWDTSDPYYYLRLEKGGVTGGEERDYVVFGGADHKTGQVDDTESRFKHLAEVLYGLIPHAEIDRRWSGQVTETNDGLPYIGLVAENQHVATGYAGNGMTYGMLAATILSDQIQGKDNPWLHLFDPNRKKLHGGTLAYLKENTSYPYYLLKDRLTHVEGRSTDEVACGEGKVLSLDGERVACSRGEDGRLEMVSAVCTHMGCLVHWNNAEKTWDCPCHGSRFHPSGKVFAGPAEAPLAKVNPSAENAPEPVGHSASS